MPYANPDTIQEVATILDDFDHGTLVELFKSQILPEDTYVSIPIDNYEPLIISYHRALNLENVESDDIQLIRRRFTALSESILKLIEMKYNITFDFDFIESHFDNLENITKSVYHFFVLDIFYIIVGILNNYIHENDDKLYEEFQAFSQRRDVSTLTNMKTMTEKYAVILSSIYDVADYSFSLLDNDLLFDYLSKDYEPAKVIKNLLDRGILVGDFTRVIADLFKSNIELRAKVINEIAVRIYEKGYLEDNPITIPVHKLPEHLTDTPNEPIDDEESLS